MLDINSDNSGYTLKRFFTALVLSLPVLAYYLPAHLSGANAAASLAGIELNFAYWICASLVQFGAGWIIYQRAWQDIKAPRLSVDVAAAVIATAAYVYCTFGFLLFGVARPFWEGSAVFVPLVLLVQYLKFKADTAE
jgi:cation transport ATPase